MWCNDLRCFWSDVMCWGSSERTSCLSGGGKWGYKNDNFIHWSKEKTLKHFMGFKTLKLTKKKLFHVWTISFRTVARNLFRVAIQKKTFRGNFNFKYKCDLNLSVLQKNYGVIKVFVKNDTMTPVIPKWGFVRILRGFTRF